MMRQTQSLPEETERRWVLSQMCGFYQHRCATSELYSDSCIRIMGESCSSRLLQCSLINAMQNLEPAMETRTKGKYTHSYTPLYMYKIELEIKQKWIFRNLALEGREECQCAHSSLSPVFCSFVWTEGLRWKDPYTAKLTDHGWLSGATWQLALDCQPAAEWSFDVWRSPGGQLLGTHCCTLLHWVRA